jgi:hypothetical protein
MLSLETLLTFYITRVKRNLNLDNYLRVYKY